MTDSTCLALLTGKIRVFLREGGCRGLQRKLWKSSSLLILCLAPRSAQMWLGWVLPTRSMETHSPAVLLVVWLCSGANTEKRVGGSSQSSVWPRASPQWEKEGSAGDTGHCLTCSQHKTEAWPRSPAVSPGMALNSEPSSVFCRPRYEAPKTEHGHEPRQGMARFRSGTEDDPSELQAQPDL